MDFSKNHIGTLPLISMLIDDNPEPIVLLNSKGIEIIRNTAAKKITYLEIKNIREGIQNRIPDHHQLILSNIGNHTTMSHH